MGYLANDASLSTISYEIVPFARNRRWRRIRVARKQARERQETKVNNGNIQNGLQTTLRAAIYSSGELASKERNASEPMYARLVGGATLWPMANLLSAPKSPFITSIWKNNLTDYPNQTFVDDYYMTLTMVYIWVLPETVLHRFHQIIFPRYHYPEAITHELEGDQS